MPRSTARRRREGPAAPPFALPLERRRLLSAELLLDVNTAPGDALPSPMIEFKGALYASADGPHGQEIYRSDGTEAGSVLLKDIRPGAESSIPRDFRIAGDYLYFTAGDGYVGRELWRTDGTEAGTVQLTTARGPAGHALPPSVLTAVGDALYFAAFHPALGHALWKSDGTPAGTLPFFNPPGESADPGVSAVHDAGGGALYFGTNAVTPGATAKLWRSDGTAAGTVLVRDFGRGGVGEMADVGGGRTVFRAADSTGTLPGAGGELWVTGGTPDTTVLLKDIVPGAGSSSPYWFYGAGGNVLFSARDRQERETLWRTDGTADGTVLLGNLAAHSFAPLNGLVYFAAVETDGTPPTPRGLWRTDGTPEGTVFVTSAVMLGSVREPAILPAAGGLLFVDRGRDSPGLWKSDGTAAGTTLLRGLQPVGPLTRFRDGVAFGAGDGPEAARTLWISDGTAEGTASAGAFTGRTAGSWPYNPTVQMPRTGAPVRVGDRTLFAAVAPSGGALWATDGTRGGTARVSAFTDTQVLGFAPARRSDGSPFAYVLGRGGPGGPDATLWTTDGTNAGTTAVRQVVVRPGPYGPVESLAVMGGELYFAGDLPEDRRGIELMKSDGTAAGTVRVKDLWDGADGTPPDGNPGNLTTVGERVFFTARERFAGGDAGNELWVTDGTPDGTRRLATFLYEEHAPDPPGERARLLVDVNGTLLFRAWGRVGGFNDQLWKSDGTAEGTVLVRDFGNQTSDRTSMVVMGGNAYFVASPAGSPRPGVVKSDGTAAGTVFVAGGEFDGPPTSPKELFAAGGRVYFSAIDPAAGRELWSTDGTPAGTYRAGEPEPGGSSQPRVLGAAGGRVYFAATTTGRGTELWSTDGTPGDVLLVADLVPGPVGSVPLHVTEATGGRAVFWADDRRHGYEPWVAHPPPQQPSFVRGRHLFYNNSRFDGRGAAAEEADDGAIAPDKQPLLPGGAATFANVSGYSRGLNGLMIDLDKRLDFITGDRFTFRVGRGGDVGGWAVAPAPLSVARRSGPGGSERVSFTWADGAIRNAWLEVKVEVLSGESVVGVDVFYFGNLPGETGRGATPGAALRIDALDVARTRAARLPGGAGLRNVFDHNRDGAVNATDIAITRANAAAALQPPATPPATAAGPLERTRGAYRPGLMLDRDAPSAAGPSV